MKRAGFTNTAASFLLQPAVTKAASFTGEVFPGFANVKDLIVTLAVTAAEKATDETYDVYITSGDGVSTWDIAHFPQIASTGAKTYTALIQGSSRPVTTTTAAPGVEAVQTAMLKTDTESSDQGVLTLTAGMVRHGPFGDRIGHRLVVAGTVETGIAYSITMTPKA